MISLSAIRNRLRQSAGTIVVRLRFVLVMVAVVTTIAGIVGTLQTRQILAAHAQLNHRTLPMLEQAQKVEQRLNGMFIIHENFSAAETADDLRATAAELSGESKALRDSVAPIGQLLETPDLIERIIATVDAAEASAQRVLNRRVSIIRMQEEADAIVDRIEVMQRNAFRALEKMSFVTTSEIDALLQDARRGQSVSSETMDMVFSDLFLSSLNQSNLLLQLESIVDLARSEKFRTATSSLSDIKSVLNAKLNDVTWQLSQLTVGEDRALLAVLTGDLRRLLLDDDGLFARLEAQTILRGELAEARGSRSQLVQETTLLAHQLVAGARAEVRTSSEMLNTATRRLIWTLTVALVISLGTVLATNNGIVEKQISRRMKRLNHSVSAIASGNLEHPITVSGQDELGDMAKALKIFKQNALELRRSNIELEKFAYIAAHDLRSPLRAIHDLSTWTLEDQKNELSGESLAYLSLLQSRVDRLNRLLNDLLDYARAGQSELVPQDVDTGQLIQQLVAGVDPDGRFKVTYSGPTQAVRTYATPLTQILTNLISNAIKHHDKATGAVHIQAHVSDGRLHLSCQDDGPGISRAYQAKVFELFQTLRPRDDVEGSGLGLAIVSKLAEYHGGKVTLTSDPETARGTRFDVDLPFFEGVGAEPQLNSLLAAE